MGVRAVGALLGLLVVIGCEDWLLDAPPADTPVAIFDQVWGEVDRYYAHFTVKDVDWAAVRAELRPPAGAEVGAGSLYAVVCDMLTRLQDVHVSLHAPAPLDRCGPALWYPPYPHGFDLAVVRARYLDAGGERAGGGRLTYGRIGPEIGYLHVAAFDGDGWVGEVDAILHGLRPFEALVVDVRDNGGGSSTNGDALAGRFADRRRVNSYVQYRDGPAHDDFTAPRPRHVEPTGRERFTGPVTVLTNRYCFSACEGFVLAMDVLPHVSLVGDTTGGGLGNPIFREIQNGWTFRVPVWLQTTPEGEVLEGVGIAPDLPIAITDQGDEEGRDPILEAAVEELRRASGVIARGGGP